MIKSEKKTSNNSFLTGALILTAGGLLAKILGAVYRIPLTNLLGTYAMGLYQLVFPLYTLLITISMGFTVAVSKEIARAHELNYCSDCKRILKCSLVILGSAGALFTILLYVFSDKIAAVQGNIQAAMAYKILSPAIILVCLSSALKGYFQGQMKMQPTAISLVAEQVVKLVLGLALAYRYMPDQIKAVNASVFAVTASEIVALLVYLIAFFVKKENTVCMTPVTSKKIIYGRLFKTAIPVTLGGVLLPLSQLIDSSLILNLISNEATRMYGIWSGPVHSLYAMPVILAGGIAAAILPSISGSAAKRNLDSINHKIGMALKLNNVIVMPCVVGFLLLSRPIIKLLYSALPSSDVVLSAQLLMVTALGTLLLSYSGTITSILQGLGKEFVSLAFLTISIAIKTVFSIFLLPNPAVNIFAVAFSLLLCYFVYVTVCAIYLGSKFKIRINIYPVFTKPLLCCLIMSVPIVLFSVTAADFVNSIRGTILVIVIAVVVYAAAVLVLKVFEGLSPKQISKYIYRGKKHAKTGITAD